MKWHRGTTYKEVIKNLLSLRMPVLGADREWNAIHRLASLGVDTMQGVAFGETGWNPVKKTSFIITEDLTPTISPKIIVRIGVLNPASARKKNADSTCSRYGSRDASWRC